MIRKSWPILVVIISVLAGLLLTAPLALAGSFQVSKDSASNISLVTPLKDDCFFVGDNVTISAPVTGEAFLAGNSVTLANRPDRSIFVAGNTVLVNNGAGYNIFAAGNTVTVNGDIGHDTYIAGNSVTVLPGTVIHGSLHIAASTVTLAGAVNGDVLVNAGRVTSSANINGNFRGQIQDLAFTSGAIGQDLNYRSSTDASGLTNVSVNGLTTRHDLPVRTNHHSLRVFRLANFLFGLVATIVAGLVLIWLASGQIKRVQTEVKTNWANNTLRGVAVFFAGPIIIFLVALTIIGLKIAVILGLFYVLSLLVTMIFASFLLGHWLLSQLFKINQSELWQDLVVGRVVIALLALIPIVNIFVGLILFVGVILPTLGALVVGFGKQLRS